MLELNCLGIANQTTKQLQFSASQYNVLLSSTKANTSWIILQLKPHAKHFLKATVLGKTGSALALDNIYVVVALTHCWFSKALAFEIIL
jgi:hypothetical protein